MDKIPKIIIDREKNLVSFMFKDFKERAEFMCKYLSHDAYVLGRYSDDGRNITFVVDEIPDYILIGPGLGLGIDCGE